jgi:hypothetical protein
MWGINAITLRIQRVRTFLTRKDQNKGRGQKVQVLEEKMQVNIC